MSSAMIMGHGMHDPRGTQTGHKRTVNGRANTQVARAKGARAYGNAYNSKQSVSSPVKYDVSAGASRVAQIMNEDPYLAESRNTAVLGVNADATEAGKDSTGTVQGSSVKGNEASQTDAAKDGVIPASQNNIPKDTSDPAAMLEDGIEAEEAAIEEEAEEKKDKTGGYTEEDVDNLERMLERLKEKQEKKSGKSGKKKLNYNHKRVSSAIMRSKNRVQASNALKSAKSVLSDLKRKAASQQYSDEELEIAITHANKMIRAARRKVSHLKSEEQQDQFDKDAGQSKESKNNRMKQKVRSQKILDPQKVDVKLDQELYTLKKRLKQITHSEKLGHRRNENFELLEADMEYLKKKISLMQQEQSENKTTADTQSGESEGASSDALAAETAAAAEGDAAQVEASAEASQAIAEVSAGASVDVTL